MQVIKLVAEATSIIGLTNKHWTFIIQRLETFVKNFVTNAYYKRFYYYF